MGGSIAGGSPGVGTVVRAHPVLRRVSASAGICSGIGLLVVVILSVLVI